ncbi:Estradiol 17-beta-dehydrogenase 12-B [Fukomys damarensis]|uniref:17beta-estradiol 17-dehydrogenase n=1 Tax=Fukomys damarensis TaxID=885580 RepID=A0A091CNA7_FUKDA|nr:Estradiol 17-beta-dehydrogenase 12-B [Fukomys damarensis]
MCDRPLSIMVTGATGGIGKAYAHELARRGLNVVLLSRSLSKLEEEAREIADFTKGLEIYDDIEAGLQGLEIGVLVNNVGMAYGGGGVNFQKVLDSENVGQNILDIINCNLMSVTQMTRLILPQMVNRGRGVIINMSSVAGYRSFPFHTLYSATKAFVQCFSESVSAEYSAQGVTIQSCLLRFLLPKWLSHSRWAVRFLAKQREARLSSSLRPVTSKSK